MAELSCQSCIRGYHVYMDCWDAPVGEELVCKPQENNSSDDYAVAVLRTCDDTIVGHLPRKISRMCWLFLKKPDSKITCTVEGPRRHSADLPQGGLEVPVKLKVIGKETEVNKIYKLLQMCGGPACCNIVYVKE